MLHRDGLSPVWGYSGGMRYGEIYNLYFYPEERPQSGLHHTIPSTNQGIRIDPVSHLIYPCNEWLRCMIYTLTGLIPHITTGCLRVRYLSTHSYMLLIISPSDAEWILDGGEGLDLACPDYMGGPQGDVEISDAGSIAGI